MRIQIDVEVLVILALVFMFVVWLGWYYLSKRWNNRRYKPENDKGRIGEEHRQELIREGLPDPAKGIDRGVGTNKSPSKDSPGQRVPKGRISVPTADADSVGEDGDKLGKDVRKFNPFRRWRKNSK